MASPPAASPLVERARELARVAHEGQLRKALGIPYFNHLENVAGILREHGYADATTQAAAYLHDILEDRPAFAQQFHDAMPESVVAAVAALTEKKVDEAGRPLDKATRFAGYVRALAAGTEAARAALPISCADKIDNLRSIVEAERAGAGLLLRLKTRPGEHATQMAALRALYDGVVADALLATFDAACAALQATLDAWLPGRAVAIAAEAHVGQFDKAGAPYIGHPLRLWMRAETPAAKMAAVLHDVVEDTPWTLEALAREGIPERVLRALACLTRQEGESYDDFIERIAKDRLATRVKLLDLEDNSDLSRLPVVTEADRARVEKYRRASERLRAELRKRSLQIVLDDASAAAVGRLAVHGETRAHHVTLAHRVDPDALEAAWIPGGGRVGDRVDFRAVGEVADERLQALVVEIAGSTVRPHDGGVLHVTVSRAKGARSREANALVAKGPVRAMKLPLAGEIRWVD